MIRGNPRGVALKTVLTSGLLALSLLFAGALPEMNGTLTRKQAAPPAWLSIPLTAEVTEIVYSGSPGMEATRGTIRVVANGPALDAISLMKTYLALQGFVVREKSVRPTLSNVTRQVTMADHPATGQSAIVVPAQGPLGEEIYVSFADPVVAVAGLSH
jgi:hypothetical protein